MVFGDILTKVQSHFTFIHYPNKHQKHHKVKYNGIPFTEKQTTLTTACLLLFRLQF